MPRAHSAVEAIDREAERLVQKLARARERDASFTDKLNDLTLVIRQNQALMDDINDRLNRLGDARDAIEGAAPEEISLSVEDI